MTPDANQRQATITITTTTTAYKMSTVLVLTEKLDDKISTTGTHSSAQIHSHTVCWPNLENFVPVDVETIQTGGGVAVPRGTRTRFVFRRFVRSI